jgi:TP901 family phage tail tape measure protein
MNQEIVLKITGMDAASGPIKAVTGALGGLENAASRAGGMVTGALGSLAKVGVAATAAGIAGLAGGFVAATNAARGFEATLSGIAAVGGKEAAASMKELSALALQLGRDTAFSATESARGMEELIKAGVSVADIMGGAAKASLDLAAAGGTTVAEAATIAAQAMNNFNLKGADLGHVADMIAGAANASAIDVKQFGFSMQQSGAAAALAGISFDDLATAIALMGNAGIVGSDAGTSLKTMFMSLQPSTKKQTDLFKELGIITKSGANQFFDAQGKAKGLADIAGVLQDATKGMTDQQKMATLEVMFGSDALRAAAILTRAGASGFKELAGEMGKVSASDVAEKRLDNLNGSLEKLKGSLETAAITLGQNFLPGLTRLVRGADSAVDASLPLIEAWGPKLGAAFDRAIDRVLRLRVNLGPLATAAGALAEVFGRIVPAALGRAHAAYITVESAIGRLVGLDLDDYASGWDTLGGIVRRSMGIARQAFIDVTQEAGRLVGLELDDYAAGWDTLGGTIRRVADMVREPLQQVGTAILNGWVENFRFLTQVTLPSFLKIATDTFGFLFRVVLPDLPTLGSTLRGILGDTIIWLAQDAWPKLLRIVEHVWRFLIGTILPELPGLAGALRNILGGALGWLAEEGFPRLFEAAGSALTWIKTTGVEAVTTIWDWLGPKLSAALTWLTEEGWPTFLGAAQAAWNWISNEGVAAASAIWGWLSPKLGAVVSWFTDTAWPSFLRAAEAVWNWIRTTAVPAAEELWSELSAYLTPAVEWLINEGWPGFLRAVEAAWNWVRNEAVPTAQELFSELESYLTPAVEWFIQTGWPEMQRLASAAWEEHKNMWTWAVNLYQEVTNDRQIQETWNEILRIGGEMAAAFGRDLGVLAKSTTDTEAAMRGAHTPTQAFVGEIRTALKDVRDFLNMMNDLAKALNAIQAGGRNAAIAIRQILDALGIPRVEVPGVPQLPGTPAPKPIDPFAPPDWPGRGGAPAGNMSPEQYLRWAAQQRGLNPDDVIRTAMGEGGITEWNRQGTFDTGTSFGPLQLHYAGGSNPQKGLGDEFTALTGKHATEDPQGAIDFALDVIAREGYGKWYGAPADLRARGRTPQGTPIGIGAGRQSMPLSDAGASGALRVPPQVSQFAASALTAEQAAAACGPAAALWFAQITGRNPTLEEATALAREVGWTPQRGMAGPASEVALLGRLGVDAVADMSPTETEAKSLAGAGTPFLLSTPGHYFQVSGMDEQGRLNVGASGTALKGGSAFMSIQEIEALKGPMQAIITLSDEASSGLVRMGDAGGAAGQAVAAGAAQGARGFDAFAAGARALSSEVKLAGFSSDQAGRSLLELAASTGVSTAGLDALNAGTATTDQALGMLVGSLAETRPEFAALRDQIALNEQVNIDFADSLTNQAIKAAASTSPALNAMAGAMVDLGGRVDSGSISFADFSRELAQTAADAGLTDAPLRGLQSGLLNNEEALLGVLDAMADADPAFAALRDQFRNTGIDGGNLAQLIMDKLAGKGGALDAAGDATVGLRTTTKTGWEGIVEQIKIAAEAIITAIDRMAGLVKQMMDEINGLKATVVVDADTRRAQSAVNELLDKIDEADTLSRSFGPRVERRHGGGEVLAGMPYIVGGPGAEELFVPGTSGVVLSHAATMRALRSPQPFGGGGLSVPGGAGAIDYDRLAAALARQPIVVEVDGRTIATVTRSEHLRTGRRNARNAWGDLG